jgi:CRP/FNR family transcriptional regulator
MLGMPSEALTLENLFAAQPADKFAAGEGVFWEGDAASDIFQITEGCLRLYRVLPDGRRAIMGFRFAGEMLGLSCEGSYCYTAEAVTSVRLRRLSRARLRVMGEGTGQLQSLLLTKIFEEIRAAQQHIIVLGQLGAEERAAHFLVSAVRRTGADRMRPVAIELPMTRQDIADYLGLTIETVCRVMSKLKRDGLISLEGRHRAILLRMADLQQLAGEFDDAEPLGEQASTCSPTKRTH